MPVRKTLYGLLLLALNIAALCACPACNGDSEQSRLLSLSPFDGPWEKRTVNAMAKDNKGNIWVGYANRGMDIIKADSSVSKIPNDVIGNDNGILCMDASKKNDGVWIGCSQKGLWKARLDQGWTRFILPLDARTVFQVSEDKDGSLWILTELGTLRYWPESNKAQWLPTISQGGVRPTVLCESSLGYIFGCMDGEVFMLEKGEPKVIAKLNAPITALYYDENNKLLFIGSSIGVVVDKMDGKFVVDPKAAEEGYKPEYSYIKSIFKSSSTAGRIFVLSRDNGLCEMVRGKPVVIARSEEALGYICAIETGSGVLVGTGEGQYPMLAWNYQGKTAKSNRYSPEIKSVEIANVANAASKVLNERMAALGKQFEEDKAAGHFLGWDRQARKNSGDLFPLFNNRSCHVYFGFRNQIESFGGCSFGNSNVSLSYKADEGDSPRMWGAKEPNDGSHPDYLIPSPFGKDIQCSGFVDDHSEIYPYWKDGGLSLDCRFRRSMEEDEVVWGVLGVYVANLQWDREFTIRIVDESNKTISAAGFPSLEGGNLAKFLVRFPKEGKLRVVIGKNKSHNTFISGLFFQSLSTISLRGIEYVNKAKQYYDIGKIDANVPTRENTIRRLLAHNYRMSAIDMTSIGEDFFAKSVDFGASFLSLPYDVRIKAESQLIDLIDKELKGAWEAKNNDKLISLYTCFLANSYPMFNLMKDNQLKLSKMALADVLEQQPPNDVKRIIPGQYLLYLVGMSGTDNCLGRLAYLQMDGKYDVKNDADRYYSDIRKYEIDGALEGMSLGLGYVTYRQLLSNILEKDGGWWAMEKDAVIIKLFEVDRTLDFHLAKPGDLFKQDYSRYSNSIQDNTAKEKAVEMFLKATKGKGY